MKIKIEQYENYWNYYINEDDYTQEQYDYIFKYLDFDKLDKNEWITFNNEKLKLYMKDSYLLKSIYQNSPEKYKYLKDDWGKDSFRLHVYYLDKQELKTIVNKLINIELIIGNK